MAQKQKLGNPPDGMRSKLEQALSTRLDFVGAYSFNKTYTEAPNPSLKIDGIGAIGVPLSTRDAKAIKAKVKLPPPRKGAKADKSVRSTWEIDAKLVEFPNAEWANFMQKRVEDVCRELGVKYSASSPRCEPYKLILSEPGAPFFPHIDAEEDDGVFAAIMVVLPSEYTGGESHLSYGGVDVTYDCSQTSLNTTVIAWYTDAKHEIEPIESGYRLALSFKLIHNTNSPRPALSANSDFVEKVKQALLSWKEMSGPQVPKKMLYLLGQEIGYDDDSDEDEEDEDENPSQPKKPDAKVSLIRQIGEEIGFSLGTATVVCCLSGFSANHGRNYYGGGRNRWAQHMNFMNGYNDDDVGFGEIEEREMEIRDFVDLNGKAISKSLEVDEDIEFIPKNLPRIVESGYHTKQESHSGFLKRCEFVAPHTDIFILLTLTPGYRRTVLVIWPNKNTYDVVYTGEGLKFARDTLDKALESSTELAKYVLSRVVESPETILPSFCRAALRWNDYALWNSGVEAHFWHNNSPLLGNDDIEGAIKVFGFQAVGEGLEPALGASPTNKGSLELIVRLEEMMNTNPELDEDCNTEAVVSWAHKQRESVLGDLKKLTNDDVEIVIQTSISHDGGKFLKTRVMPQLLKQAEPDVLVKLASEIRKSAIKPAKVKTELVSKLVIAAITASNFFQPIPPPKPTQYWMYRTNDSEQKDPNLESFQQFVQTCRSLECTNALALVLEKAKLTTGMEPTDAFKRAKNVMLPLLDYVREGPGAFPKKPVKELVEVALPLALAQPKEMDASTVRSMVNALGMTGGGIDSVQKSILPKVLSPDVPPDPQLALAEEIIKLDIASREGTDQDGLEGLNAGLRPTIASLASNFAKTVKLATTSNITSGFERCGKVGATEACSTIVQRVLSTIAQANDAQLQTILIPLLSPLYKISQSNVHLGNVGVNNLLKNIIQRWIEITLGQKPTYTASSLVSLTRWTCTCAECQKVKVFLTKPSLDTPSLGLPAIGAPTRKHVEGNLTSSYGAVNTITGSGRPQGLIINLSDKMKIPLRWEKNRAAGIAMLTGISTNEQNLHEILGEYYATVLKALDVPRINKNAVTPAPQPGKPQPAVGSTPVSARASGSKPVHAKPQPTEERPAKKRKVAPNEADVIDLT